MNGLSVLKQNFTKFKTPLLSIVKKGKFRRLTQPGLTRYNWDQQEYNKYPFEVK